MHATSRTLLVALTLASAFILPDRSSAQFGGGGFPGGGFPGGSPWGSRGPGGYGDRGSYGDRGGFGDRGPGGYSPGGYSSFRGGFPGGGFPGGGFPGGGFPFGGGSSSPADMVRRADTNNNNTLEPDELQNGYGRPVRYMAERAGLNTNQPLRVDQVIAALDPSRSSSSSSSSSTPAASGMQTFAAQNQVALVP